MKYSRKGLFTCIAVVLALLLITNPRSFAQAEDPQDCTSGAVGIAASTTGEVLLMHNEDDGGRMAYSQMYVPRTSHAPGSFVNGGNLGPGMAQIPDVPETNAYYWSDSITPGGSSNDDVMQNEFGVTVFSNAMTSRERCTTTCLVNGGIDYGLNTIVIQRATSARNGVEIAAALVTQWGYNSSGRAYMIADAKEAWSFQAVKGMHYVAQRVGDNEVMVIANRYTIRKVDMVDATTTHKKFYAPPDLVTYAIAQGWYTPAVPGNYSDFDFAPTYQGTWTSGSQQDGGNTIRQWHGYEILTGQSWQNDTGNLPFSVTATRQLGVADLKSVERTHYEGTPDDLTDGYTTVPSTPHYTHDRVICTASTMESTIWQLRPNPLFNVMWRTTLRPEGPYVPWYPQTGTIPSGYSFTTPVYAQTTHYTPAVTDYQYDPSRAFWAFSDLQNLIDPMYGQVIEQELTSRDKLEQVWTAEQPVVRDVRRSSICFLLN